MSAIWMPEHLRCALELHGYTVRSGTAEDLLGSGGYGNVWRATRASTGVGMAIKVISESSDKLLNREIANQKCLKHPNVVELVEVIRVLQYVCLVLELADRGSLLKYVHGAGRLQEQQALDIFRQLIRAVEYIHIKGVYSRDIKPDNVLMAGGQPPLIKLCDFGLSKNACETPPKTKLGSIHCVAPEVIREKTQCGEKMDVWGCGVVLYYMLSGRFPFQLPRQQDKGEKGNNWQREVMERILRAPHFSLPDGVSEDCLELVKGLLRKDPKTRLSIEEVQEHRVFQRGLSGGLARWKEDSRRLQLSDSYADHNPAAAEREVGYVLMHEQDQHDEN